MALDDLSRRWLERARALSAAAPSEADDAERAAIFEHFVGAAKGNEADEAKLCEIVSLRARQLGFDKRPVSRSLVELMALGELVRASGELPAGAERVLGEILAIAVDAHALGQVERLRQHYHRQMRDGAPIVEIGGRWLVGFLIGPIVPEILDAMMARLLSMSAASGIDAVVLDILGAEEENDLLHRTLAELTKNPGVPRVTLTLTGARDPTRSRAALAGLGADLDRLRFAPRVADVLGPA